MPQESLSSSLFPSKSILPLRSDPQEKGGISPLCNPLPGGATLAGSTAQPFMVVDRRGFPPPGGISFGSPPFFPAQKSPPSLYRCPTMTPALRKRSGVSIRVPFRVLGRSSGRRLHLDCSYECSPPPPGSKFANDVSQFPFSCNWTAMESSPHLSMRFSSLNPAPLDFV